MLPCVSGTDRAILIASLRSPLIEEFYNNAMGDSARHLDAWSAIRPGEGGFSYDCIAKVCANPGAQKTPYRVCVSASLGPSLKGAHIYGAKK